MRIAQVDLENVKSYERERVIFTPGTNAICGQNGAGKSTVLEADDEQCHVARYIEVKGRGPEDADVVTMTGPEWEAARRLGDQHWLYIVLLGDGMLVMIQNPYAKLEPRELKRWLVTVTEAKGHGETDRLNNNWHRRDYI
jgi:ABC-type cobalamin/Fe3+-siderophores transport system ATPase subunit